MTSDNQQPSLRACKKCGGIFPLDSFQLYDQARGYRRHECDACRRAYQAAWARGEVQPVKEDGRRTCVVCSTEKSLEEFAKVYAKNSRGKEYRQHTCLTCWRQASAEKERRRRREKPQAYLEASRRHYWANRDKKNAAKRASKNRMRDAVFAAYGGYRCICCGETEPSMLTLDHVHNDGGADRKNNPRMRGSWQMYEYLISSNFPAGLQVLCYNCNLSKHRCGGVCAHKLKEGSTTIPQGSTAKRPEKQSTPPG